MLVEARAAEMTVPKKVSTLAANDCLSSLNKVWMPSGDNAGLIGKMSGCASMGVANTGVADTGATDTGAATVGVDNAGLAIAALLLSHLRT